MELIRLGVLEALAVEVLGGQLIMLVGRLRRQDKVVLVVMEKIRDKLLALVEVAAVLVRLVKVGLLGLLVVLVAMEQHPQLQALL
jgi:hypothetical protein